ncbi:MAG: outer membrane protein assembly factor BamE, partial [Gammaproteobacteria bacterium]|nr:outer membrane protein assembly factor BamE [Gammaproteobacteria bacterium]
FQQPGLIPLCTEVEITKAGSRKVMFKIKDSGMEYKYLNHKTAGEDLKTNALRYFGKECVKDKVAKLSAKDQEGISQGKALVGMSKQGVIYAIGYPPLGATPSTDATTWKYWFNRFNTFTVTFGADGIVTQVVN